MTRWVLLLGRFHAGPVSCSPVFGLLSAAVRHGQGDFPHGDPGRGGGGGRWVLLPLPAGPMNLQDLTMRLLSSRRVEHLGHSHILLATFEKVRELLRLYFGSLTSRAR